VFYGAGAPDALGLGETGVGLGVLGAWMRGVDASLALGWRAAAALAGCEALVSHFALPTGLLGALLRRGRPHLLVVHGTDGALLARMPAALRDAVLGGATRVWCSHEGLRVALGIDAGRCHVAPMGFDPVPPLPEARESGRVLAVGRLVPVKRPVLALEAVVRARAEGVPLSLTVLGDGPLRGRLEPLAAMAPAGVVTLAGAVGAEVRDGWLRRAELFVHTAGRAGWRTEGAPVSVLEAMHAGVAVVATDAGGVAGVLGDGGVVLPESAGAAELAGALTALHRDPARRTALVQAAQARAGQWVADRQATQVEAWLRGDSGTDDVGPGRG